MTIFICFLSIILFFNLTLFYLDDFKLSTNKYIKLLQNLSPLILVVLLILSYYDITSNFNSVLFATDSTTNISSDSITSTVNENVNKFIDDSVNSALNDLILSINIINYACLSLIFILFMVILFKFYLNEDNIKLNLSSIIGAKLNNDLNYYLIKIIQLNKKTSTEYIFIIFILLFIGLFFNCYFSS